MATTAARNEPFTLALGLSVLLHALVLTLAAVPIVRETLAAWQSSSAASSLLPAPAPPEEIEVMVPKIAVVPPASPPQAFIRTDGLPEAASSTPDSRFISDRNTRAASALPADAQGAKDIPSQEGIDIPVVEIIRTPLSEGESANQPRELVSDPPPRPPVAAAAATPPPAPATLTNDPPASAPPPPPLDLERIATTREGAFEVPTSESLTKPTTAPDPSRPPRPKKDVALRELREPAPELRETPATPSATKPPPPSLVPPPTGFSGLREPTRQHGTITNRGPASVDAADTPVGRYMKEVTGAIEREWHRKRLSHADFVTYGTIKLEFSVNRQGQVQALTIKNRNGANAVMQDFTLNAVLDAKIPPMPAGLPEVFDHDRLQISYDIIVY